jgi:hypothetical protein
MQRLRSVGVSNQPPAFPGSLRGTHRSRKGAVQTKTEHGAHHQGRLPLQGLVNNWRRRAPLPQRAMAPLDARWLPSSTGDRSRTNQSPLGRSIRPFRFPPCFSTHSPPRPAPSKPDPIQSNPCVAGSNKWAAAAELQPTLTRLPSISINAVAPPFASATHSRQTHQPHHALHHPPSTHKTQAVSIPQASSHQPWRPQQQPPRRRRPPPQQARASQRPRPPRRRRCCITWWRAARPALSSPPSGTCRRWGSLSEGAGLSCVCHTPIDRLDRVDRLDRTDRLTDGLTLPTIDHLPTATRWTRSRRACSCDRRAAPSTASS